MSIVYASASSEMLWNGGGVILVVGGVNKISTCISNPFETQKQEVFTFAK